ncbi:DNA primase family protein [Lacipirellula parvula]|nr:phage/plasmid primase, P4 family [Lacipirellula parvula]
MQEPAAFYRKTVKEFLLRAPRLGPTECPQAVLFKNRQILSDKASVRDWVLLQNGIFRFSKFAKGKRHFTRCHPRFFTKAVRPFAYDPTAQCPLWLDCLAQWLDVPSIKLLQEWMGYTCVFDSSMERFGIFLGPSRTGKSTVANVQEYLLGTDNISNLGLERFSGNFGLEELAEKLLNVSADIGNLPVVAEGQIKAISSRDRISFDRKHKSAINIRPESRLLFIGNHMPRFKDRSKAIRDRALIIAFDRSVPPNKRDRYLGDKLRAEISGIFNWSMEGLRRLRETQAFTVPPRMVEELEQMKYLANPALEYLEDYVEASEAGIVPTRRLFESYDLWCRRNGLSGRDVSNVRELGKMLKQLFPDVRKADKRIGPAKIKVYYGITIHDQDPPNRFRISDLRTEETPEEKINEAC